MVPFCKVALLCMQLYFHSGLGQIPQGIDDFEVNTVGVQAERD